MKTGKLTILHLTHQRHGSGSTAVIHGLALRLAARGHDVLLGCPGDSALAARGRDSGLTVVPLDFSRLGALAGALAEIIARRRVDLVNSHATRDRRALTWLRWRGRLPQGLVLTRHTMPRTSVIELAATGLAADRTIAVSGAVARALRRRLYPGARLRVVPNGIDLARVEAAPSAEASARAAAALGDPGGRPVLLIMARRKDQQVSVRALQFLESPVVLACVGIEADAELRALASAVPSRHRVVCVPFTSDPLAFYRLATVAALPSRIEGLSIALLEAMALGLPVVASDAGGNPDLVTAGTTGLLVPPLDPRAWAGAFARVLGDRALAARLGQAGRDLVRREYTLERTAERTEGVYLEALARRRPAPEPGR